uniref:C-type lectin domain-containing protein n=1 Tax=Acrobeloides nanus TaxID=290746 RepID=A0A914C684_9BILA
MFMFLFSLFVITFIAISVNACPAETLQGPDGKCYGFFPYGFFHNKSDYVCKEFYGGHLASIHSEKLNEFLMVNARDLFFETDNFWIGGKVYEDEGRYSWTDKSPFDYKNLEKDDEFHSDGNYGLALNKNTGKWHGIKSETVLPYVCTVYYKKRIPK